MSPPNRSLHLLWLGVFALSCGSVTSLSIDAPTDKSGAGGSASGGTTGTGGSTGQAGSAGGGSAGSGGQGDAGQAGAAGGGHGGAGQGGGGMDGGADGGTNPCRGLTQAACGATTGCSVATCPGCNGGSSYSGCYQTGKESPPQCGASMCPPSCSGNTETQCKQFANCRADYCRTCQQTMTYMGCSNVGDPIKPCSAIPCPIPCSMVTTLDQCEARTDCHSVFVDPHTCGCATVGCCAHFSVCADGDKAKCSGAPLCKIVTPFCEGTYVVSYTDVCYEGCVQKKDCAP